MPRPRSKTRLEHDAGRRRFRIRLRLLQFGDEQDHFQQVVETGLLLGRNLAGDDVTAVVLDDQLALHQLLLDAIGVGAWLVDLVDRNHQRHLRRLRVIDRFERLRLDAIIGCDHEHDDVGRFRTARAHQRERLVARRIEERDPLPPRLDLVGADMLRDAASLARGDVRAAQRIEQRRLAVVDVSHHGHDRRSGLQVFRALFEARVFHLGERDLLGLFLEAEHLRDRAELERDLDRHLGVERLVDRGEHAAAEQLRDDVFRLAVELLGQLLDGHALGERDLLRNRRKIRFRLGRHRHFGGALLVLRPILLATLLGRTASRRRGTARLEPAGATRRHSTGAAARAAAGGRTESSAAAACGRARTGAAGAATGSTTTSPQGAVEFGLGRNSFRFEHTRFASAGGAGRAARLCAAGLRPAGRRGTRCRRILRSTRSHTGARCRWAATWRGRAVAAGRDRSLRLGARGRFARWFGTRGGGRGRRRRRGRLGRGGLLGFRSARRRRRLRDGRGRLLLRRSGSHLGRGSLFSRGLDRSRLRLRGSRSRRIMALQLLLFSLERRRHALAHDVRRLRLEFVQVGLHLLAHPVQELEDQRTRNLEFLRKLINPDFTHPVSA